MSEVWEYRFSYSVDVGCIYSFSPNYLPKCYRVYLRKFACCPISFGRCSCRVHHQFVIRQLPSRRRPSAHTISLSCGRVSDKFRHDFAQHTGATDRSSSYNAKHMGWLRGLATFPSHCKVLSGRLVRIPEITRRVHWHWRCQQNLRTAHSFEMVSGI